MRKQNHYKKEMQRSYGKHFDAYYKSICVSEGNLRNAAEYADDKYNKNWTVDFQEAWYDAVSEYEQKIGTTR